MNPTELYREVIRVRLSQLFINELIKKKEFKIPLHLALGHEAIAVAVSSIMDNNKDQLLLSHRNVHYNLAREKSLRPLIDEYYLKKSGLGEGKLGSMNLNNPKKDIPYTSSILGNNLSVASGLALAKKVNNDKSLVIVVTGDGAIEEGSFYENCLFMKSNNLSSMIIVENNQWSLATSIKERRCDINLQSFCESMGIKYLYLSKNDVNDYALKIKTLKEYSIRNNAPVCIEVECTTFGFWWTETENSSLKRFINYHHGEASPQHLSTLYSLPIIEKNDKDPIFVLKKYLTEENISSISQEEHKKILEDGSI